MKRIVTNWRKATEEEIKSGSDEMVVDYVEEIDSTIPDREIPMWKLKAILKIMNIDAAIDAAIDSLSEPTRTMAKMSWEYGSVINQSSPTVNLIKSVLGLTDEDVDNIFNQSEAINL